MDRKELISRVVDAYRVCHPRHRFYVRAKLPSDPLTSELLDLAEAAGHLGDVFDAGCGRGQFSLLLGEWGGVSSVRGFELDADKVHAANLATRSDATRASAPHGCFEVDDLATATFPASDTILLLDVLHYLPLNVQDEVIARAASAVRHGGRIVIRENDRKASFGSRLGAFFEVLARAIGMNRGRTLAFRATEELAEAMRRCGLSVASNDATGPLKNVFLVGTRPVIG